MEVMALSHIARDMWERHVEVEVDAFEDKFESFPILWPWVLDQAETRDGLLGPDETHRGVHGGRLWPCPLYFRQRFVIISDYRAAGCINQDIRRVCEIPFSEWTWWPWLKTRLCGRMCRQRMLTRCTLNVVAAAMGAG